MYQAAEEACLQNGFSLATKLNTKFGWNNSYLHKGNWTMEFDCDYLPSIQGSIPYFYRPVTCGSPPSVPNGTMIHNGTHKNSYYLHDMGQYPYVNETFEMRANSFIRCLCSGEWSHCIPRCIRQLKNPLHPLLVILLVLITFLMIYTTLAFCVWCCKRNSELNKKQRV